MPVTLPAIANVKIMNLKLLILARKSKKKGFKYLNIYTTMYL